MPIKFQKRGHHPDYVVIVLVFLLVAFGLLMLASASSDLGKMQKQDSYYYLTHQLVNGLLPGVAAFLIAYFVRYQYYKKFSLLLMIFGVVLLVLVFTQFGLRANNAQRWIQVGGFSFQPAELMKIFMVIYLAAWLSNPKTNRSKKFYAGLLPLLIICGIVAGLLIFQPATSIVVVLMSAALAMYFASGAPMRYIGGLILAGLIGLVVLIAIGQGHRLQRILTYINPEQNVETTGYHIEQALTVIGSGGLLGVGFGNSTIKNNLPARIDDSIFAVIAAELGFVGAGILVGLFLFLSIKIFVIAKNTRDRFGQLLLVGFGSIIFAQSFINMAANTGLGPLTGLPLPFISYGGTALVVFLGMSGIIANVSRYS